MPSPARRLALPDLALSRPAGVVRTGMLLLLLLAVPALLGWLQPLEQALREVMALRPLAGSYVLAVSALGAILPLLVRWLARRREPVRRVLNPFLLLLATQLASEVAVVLFGGKGLGAVVGLVFSLMRLLQLRLLWPLAAPLGWLRALLLLQALVWGVNVVQIGLNRLGPLLG